MDNVALIELTERKLELKIVQTRQGRYRVIEDVVNPYDLTKDLLKDCLFSPKSRADILKILGIYRYTVENFNVSKIVAFASNVVVKARNYRGLLDEIYTHTGINFNITGDDEVVKDIYNAVNAKVDMPKGVCVYIMGYSTYIIRYNRRSAFDTFVVPYGYINLTQKYSKIEDMINFFKKELKGCSFVVNFEEEGIVGAGVPFLDVSKVAKKLLRYPIDIDNNYDLSADGVKKVVEFAKDLDIEKVKKANIVNKEPKPLISTSKDIDTKFIFRTLTPIDFSADNTKLAVKEKVGHRHDGIWETNLWIYDFEKKEARKLPQIREAVINYWAMAGGVDFDEKRWDIYPMGFDANDDNRVIVCAYAYTGEVPKFLGTWSIDVYGENSRLEALDGSYIPISTVGYRLEEEADVIPVSEVEYEAKRAKELEKAKEKDAKAAENFDKKIKKLEYERKLHQMDMDTLLKIEQRKEFLKQNYSKGSDGLTGS